jgi:hypothetical protein
MSGSNYARPDLTPSAPPVAWSDDEASGYDMQTTYLSHDEMATTYLSHDELATAHLSPYGGRGQFDGGWSDDPALHDLRSFDEPSARPWYRSPAVFVAVAALAVVIGAVVFVMKTSRSNDVNNVPAGSSVQSTPPSPAPSSSTPPPTSTTPTSTTPSSPVTSSSASTPPTSAAAPGGGASTYHGSSGGSGTGGGSSVQSPKAGNSTTPGNGTAGGGMSTALPTSPSTVVGQPTSGPATSAGQAPITISIPIQPGHILKCLFKPQPCS